MSVADAAQRFAALDAQRSFIVQAPAGSGKTGLLVQRYLLLLAQVDAPEEIIAITFTRKAAAEMRGRILAALRAAANTATPKNDHDRVTWQLAGQVLVRDGELQWDVLNNPMRLRIQTIDSLCASLTQQMPVTARFGAAAQQTEDAAPLYAQAVQNTLAMLDDEMPWSTAVATLLLHLDNNFAEVERLLGDMLARRDQWLRHVVAAPRRRDIRAHLENALRRVVDGYLVELDTMLSTSLRQELVTLARYAATELRAADIDSDLIAFSAQIAWPTAHADDLALWTALAEMLVTGDGTWRKAITRRQGFPTKAPGDSSARIEQVKEMKQRCLALLESLTGNDELREKLHAVRDLPPVSYDENQWRILQALFQLLPIASAQLYEVFRHRGRVDFPQVMHAALQGLGEPEAPTDLALALDYRIRHLLVDEFQDTSFSQFLLLEKLTAGWQEGDGRTLFLVGDPMQSIYRFRQADVGLFLSARQRGINHIQLQSLTLTVNFRSNAGIVEWVNATFRAILPQHENAEMGAVPHAAAIAARDFTLGEAVHVHPFFNGDALVEAAEVLRIVRQSIQENNAASIAILVRSRRHVAVIAQQLKRHNIAYRAVEIDHLLHTAHIQDLLALTRALLFWHDRVAWLALLRGPWCGLTLRDLQVLAMPATQLIWQRCGDETALRELSADGLARVRRFVTALQPFMMQQGGLQVQTMVEMAWLALGGPACVDSAAALADARSYFDLLVEMEREYGFVDLDMLFARMERLYAKPNTAEQANVQLMTIHRAKGLEFDVVILPGLGRSSRAESSALLLWAERATTGEQSDLLLAPIKAKDQEDDQTYRYLRKIEQRKQANEAGRLLYVATTRARQRLHLLGHVVAKEGEADVLPSPRSGSFLAQLWPVVAGDFVLGLHTHHEQLSNLLVDAAPAPQWRRLPVDYVIPAPPTALLKTESPLAFAQRLRNDGEEIEFSWASQNAQLVGTVVHSLLRTITETGFEHWTVSKVTQRTNHVRRELAALGVLETDLSWTSQRVIEAICNVLSDAQGRWLLNHQWRDSQCELALSGVIDGAVHNIVIDRTFVDDHGVRWIIDYKTGAHKGTDVDEFLDSETTRYRGQLARYAQLMGAYDRRPIRLGLYFPVLAAWREVKT